MAVLVDLKLLRSKLSKQISESDMRDCRLPSMFKIAFTEFGKYKIEEYYDYTLKISSQKSVCIVPNQWVYIAASCCEYNRELVAYRNKLISLGITDDMFEACHPSSDNRAIPESEKTKEALEKKARTYLASYIGEDKELLISFLWDYDSWGGGKNIKRGNDFAESPVLDIANSINASSSLIGTMAKALSERLDCLEMLQNGPQWDKFYSTLSNNSQVSTLDDFAGTSNAYLTAIRTKPFILLAGISGTGKSRIVRKLAQATDDIDKFANDGDRWKCSRPANFELIQVKPNWHNSMDVVGFQSNIPEPHYEFTPFVDFVVKAWCHENTPFFLCLDEMNLAPVEEYFAEFLSAIESRSIGEDGEFETDPIIKPFDSFGTELSGAMMRHFVEMDYDIPNDVENRLRKKGLTLPKNLIVMGTVNMDETTFSFSRKVLDRAMSIEMNEVNYDDFIEGKTEYNIPKLTEQNGLLVNRPISAQEVKDGIEAQEVMDFLKGVNDILEGTPFKLGYRAANEAMLYVAADKLVGSDNLKAALDDFTLMKILSRIEGDDSKLITQQGDKLLDKLYELLNSDGVFGTLKNSKSLAKLNNMRDTFKRDHFVSFWG